MQPYTGFAAVYDLFMEDVPYDTWAEDMKNILYKEGMKDGIVLELACGTGSITRRLKEYGYDMIGIDSSEDMLEIAREKSDYEDGILYLCQDMRSFELYGTVRAIVCVCDSLNYLTEAEDVKKVFELANNYLDEKGVFLFDFDTPYAYQEVIGDKTIAETREEGSFIWENTYYEEQGMNETNLTLFYPEIEDEETGECFYRKYEETHYRKGYSLENMKKIVEDAGMEWVMAYDIDTKKEPTATTERIVAMVRETKQANKMYV